MNEERVLYEELKPCEFRKRIKAAPIAYLPLGTLEWHGEHMPLGADGIQSQLFFELLAKEVGGIVLPKLFLGPDGMKLKDGKELYGMDNCGFEKENQKYEDQQLDGSAYWVPNETFKTLLDSIAKQISRAGFKIWVAHGHGPSADFFLKYKDEWKERYGLTCFNCFGNFEDNQLDKGLQVDHGGMNETSIVMALRPELVDLGKLPEDMNIWPKAIGLADPRIHAKPEVGLNAVEYTKNRMIKLLEEELKERN